MNGLTTVNDLPPSAAIYDPAGAALVAREAQEVQGAIIAAKKFPRDQKSAFTRIMGACERVGLAEQASYAYKRGGQTVSGPSIRLAEVLAQNWGNLSFGIRELSRDPGSSQCLAYCWDLETNVRRDMVFTVNHVRDKGNSTVALTSERDIYEMIANMGARRMRNCVLAVIPGDVCEAAEKQCEKTLGGAKDIKERITALVKSFHDLGVSVEDIEHRLGKKLDAMTGAEFVQFRKIYSGIKDGASKREDWFEARLDPEKIKRAQTEAAEGGAPATPADHAVANADKAAAVREFQAIVAEIRKGGGDPEALLGMKINHVLLSDVNFILAKCDLLAEMRKGAQ